MKKTVADYLAMGMDEKTARYFADGRRRIVSAKPSQGYTILLSFETASIVSWIVRQSSRRGSTIAL